MKSDIRIVSHDFIDLPIITFKGFKYWISYVPFLYVAGQGKTQEESIKDIQDGIETFFEGENIKEIIEKKIPIPKSPISLELLRFNIVDNKIKPVTTY